MSDASLPEKHHAQIHTLRPPREQASAALQLCEARVIQPAEHPSPRRPSAGVWARGDQDDNPAWLEAKVSEASAGETAARERLIGTAPTTTAGALAYIGHLTGWSCFGGGISIERKDFHAVMATLHTFIAKEVQS